MGDDETQQDVIAAGGHQFSGLRNDFARAKRRRWKDIIFQQRRYAIIPARIVLSVVAPGVEIERLDPSIVAPRAFLGCWRRGIGGQGSMGLFCHSSPTSSIISATRAVSSSESSVESGLAEFGIGFNNCSAFAFAGAGSAGAAGGSSAAAQRAARTRTMLAAAPPHPFG